MRLINVGNIKNEFLQIQFARKKLCQKKVWECQESNPRLLGEKRECYLYAMPPLIYCFCLRLALIVLLPQTAQPRLIFYVSKQLKISEFSVFPNNFIPVETKSVGKSWHWTQVLLLCMQQLQPLSRGSSGDTEQCYNRGISGKWTQTGSKPQLLTRSNLSRLAYQQKWLNCNSQTVH